MSDRRAVACHVENRVVRWIRTDEGRSIARSLPILARKVEAAEGSAAEEPIAVASQEGE
jgi:hypothetical protein